jgi:hypothetical protein
MLRQQHEADEAKKVKKRPRDKAAARERRAATPRRHRATASDSERHKATLDDSPRARLFRECVPALIALNIAESRARSLLASWLKLTHDDDQLVTAAVLRARDEQVVDAPGWILATLKQRMGNGNGTGAHRAAAASGQGASGQDAILAGMGRLADRVRDRRASERRQREASEHDDAPGEPDARLL